VTDVAPHTIDAGFAAARSPHVYTVEIDGEAVLLDEANDRLHHLNHTGALLWSLVDGTTPLTALASELADELDGSVQQITADLVQITRELGAEGLLAGVVQGER
jgi:Coenzyme PQQ synthesis protein D (PqqD)